MAIGITNGPKTVFFMTLSGPVQPLGQALEEITREGYDGHAYRRLGLRGEPFELMGFADHASAASMFAAIEDLKAMQGTICSITDDHGEYHDDLMLRMVRIADSRRVAGASGGLASGTFFLAASLELQKVE